jgi:hypothetical protein
MIVFGYAKQSRRNLRGVLEIQVRIPTIHGPWSMAEYRGELVRNYIRDEDLPYFQSIELPRIPQSGDVVALEALDSGSTEWLVIGLTGANYFS